MLTLILGSLYLGWYHWPGWYLDRCKDSGAGLICVDVVLRTTLTLDHCQSDQAAARTDARHRHHRAVQICALAYGSASLWNGRPLYYAFSENALSVVQAYDIDDHEAQLARKQNPEFAPHWYSLPRWVWAPRPGKIPRKAKRSNQKVAT